ncbi:hypothetical protein ElyMa_007036200 [Elysia marginata]|uniref:Uncharacterized protein n=1 Tax=Elysia marginata TaxID=1093978 RepID=A0AAV4JV09_9GAST|nr:hypothetical protein ElyMa_007036200 [Elysia marginata]
MSDLYEKFLAMATKLKVPEPDLLEWVQARVESEEKAMAKAIERDEEARERETDRELEPEKKKMDERARDRELELERKKIDLQIAQQTHGSGSKARPENGKI